MKTSNNHVVFHETSNLWYRNIKVWCVLCLVFKISVSGYMVHDTLVQQVRDDNNYQQPLITLQSYTVNAELK